MKIRHEDRGGITVVAVKGEMTFGGLDAFERLTDDLLGGGIRGLVLELGGVKFIDSQGLATLLTVRERAAECRCRLWLAGLTEELSQVLRITRLHQAFELCQSVDQAIERASGVGEGPPGRAEGP